MSVRSIKKEGRANNEEESNNPHPNDNKKAGDESADHNLSSAQGNVDEPHSEQPKEGREVAQPEEEPKTTRPRRSARAQSVALAKSDPKKPESVKRMPTRSRKAVKQEESSKIDEPMEMTHSQLHDIETQAAKTRSSEEEPIEQSLSADPKGHPASASKPAVSSPEILNPVTENNHKLPAKQADPPAMSGFEESDPEDAPTVKRDEVQVSDAYETPKKGVDENSKPEGSDPDVVFIEPKKPVETGPPVPFKGQTRAQYNALNPFVAPPCDLEVNARLKDVYVQPEDEDEFINQIASEPLPFELREKPSTSRTTLRPSRRESAKSPKKTPSAPKKEAAPKKNTPSKKETAAAKVEKEESPKATPPSKPPRKAPTNITPNKPSQKKTPVMKKEEPEEPEEEEEPQAEEPPAPKTPKGRGGRKSAAKTTPVKTEDGADFRMPEPVVRELTPAASGSGRPQRQRKIPAKFSEDVVLESAVLNNSVPELRKEPKTRPTRTQRKSMSVAPDEPKKPKRKSICEPETPKEDSVPCAPHEEVVPDETKDPKEEATSPDELPETVAPEPTVEEAPMPEAPAEKTAEATPETKVEDTTVVESDISKETPSNEATSASEPAHEPAESDVKADIIPFAIEIPKMEEEDLAALESSSSSETLLATAPNSSVRSSGRVRKKPPERDFYPGQHYANRSEPRRKSQKVSESDEYDIDPNLLAEILSHTEKLEKTICSPKGAGEVAEVAVEAVVPPPQPTKGVKRKRTESEITTEGSEPTETKPKSKKIVKKPSEVVFKTPLPPKPRAPRKISILESPIPAELKVETPSTPSTPMNFPVILSGPQLEMKNYNQPEQFFTVDHWNSSEYSDYLEFIEERQKSNSQSVGLGFLRETLPSTEDFFYREVLRSGGDLKRVDSSPMKRMNVEKSEIDVCETEELRQKDLMTADPAERIAKDIVDFLPRPKKEISAPEGEAMEVDDDDDHMWNIEDAKALAQKHENPRFSRLLNDVINVISAQFVSFVSSFGRDGGPAIYYSHSVENGRRLGNLLHRCIGDEKDFPNAIHEWMIRNLPLEFLARYLDIVRFLAEQNKQNDLIMHMMSIGTDVMVNSCHNWVLEFTLAQTADPHTDLVKHSLKTVKLHEVVFVIVHPNLTRAPSTKAHVAMFRDLLPGIAEHVDVKLNCPDDLTKNYDILCYTVDTVIQEVEETLQRYPNHHVVVAAWGVACRIVQKALQDVAGVTATLMFAYPNEAIAADPDDDANLTYCPSLFIAGENTCADYIKRLKTTRSLMIADTGLVVVANADRNLLVSATRLGIERLSQRTVDRAIVEHVYDFLKLVMKQANSNMRQHRKEMAPLDMAAFMEASNTTIEDHKIKKTLFQSPSTARSSASRHKS
ncbi:hypothetical protein QR680_006941 [Steinernema hermaphroditum]|uniref:KANSL3 helical domain-containing protein n=1 Tax=Steinernema hermaphroditum TaxID=289476 RepID=A0AA39HYM2_9BILA|nr:hypothetical protein QR680_006941 [Steinernema hermaphroditum]